MSCLNHPDRLETEPKSILTAEVKPVNFPFVMKNEERDLLDGRKPVDKRWKTPRSASIQFHRTARVHRLPSATEVEVGPGGRAICRRRRSQPALVFAAGTCAVECNLKYALLKLEGKIWERSISE